MEEGGVGTRNEARIQGAQRAMALSMSEMSAFTMMVVTLSGFVSFVIVSQYEYAQRKGKLGVYAINRVAAGAHLPTSWFFGPAKRPEDRADYCLNKCVKWYIPLSGFDYIWSENLWILNFESCRFSNGCCGRYWWRRRLWSSPNPSYKSETTVWSLSG